MQPGKRAHKLALGAVRSRGACPPGATEWGQNVKDSRTAAAPDGFGHRGGRRAEARRYHTAECACRYFLLAERFAGDIARD